MQRRWELAWDFFRGGVHVLSPDHEIGRVRWAQPVATDDTGTASEPARKTSDYRWVSGASRSYLWKAENETLEEYYDRSARAIALPLFQHVVNVFVSGILKVGPKRGDSAEPGEPWASYWRDVDMAGTNLDAFIRSALSQALAFGRVHAVTDRPRFEEPAASLGEEIERGDRPYSYLVTPLDLVDWRMDTRGRFVWACIREPAPDDRGPGKEPGEQLYRFRTWWADWWELWTETSAGSQIGAPKNYEFIEGGPNPIGRVPVATLYSALDARPGAMQCESPLANVLDADRDLLNETSELREIDRMQAFGVFCYPTADGMPGPIDIGVNRALAVPPDGNMPTYVSPDASLPAGKWQRMTERMNAVRQLAGIGRGRAEYSKEERSASSLTLESEDKRNQMAVWAAATEEFDRQLHRDVLAWMGRAEDEFPEPSYSRNYELRSTADQIADLVQLNAMKVASRDTVAELLKPVVGRMLADDGVPADRAAEIVDMLNEAPEPEPVAAPFGKPTPFGKPASAKEPKE